MNRSIVTLLVLSALSSVAASASAQTFPEPGCRDDEDSFQVCDPVVYISRCAAESQALDCKNSGRCTDVTTLPCPTTVASDGTVQYCCTACAPVVNSSVPPVDPIEESKAENGKLAVCRQTLSCSGPPPPPVLGIFSGYCGGMYSMNWSQAAGSLRYQVQAKSRPAYPWSLVPESPGFPGIIVDVDEDQLGCSGESNGDFVARARACNVCGCSAWGPQYEFTYFTGECR